MKKIIAILLALALVLCFAACGKTETPEEKKEESSTPVSSRVEDPEDSEEPENSSKEPLVLDGDDEYVVVGRKDDAMLTSIKDIKGKKVGMIYETDSQKIAEYYDAVCLGYGTDHDAYSGMSDRTKLDYIIVSKIGAVDRVASNKEYKIILEKIVIE